MELTKTGKTQSDVLIVSGVFTYAVKATQELSEIVKQQQKQIDDQNQKIDKLIMCDFLCLVLLIWLISSL